MIKSIFEFFLSFFKKKTEFFLSFFKKKTYQCFNCGRIEEDFKKTATIKVRYGNDQMMDMIICSTCAGRLENLKKKV